MFFQLQFFRCLGISRSHRHRGSCGTEPGAWSHRREFGSSIFNWSKDLHIIKGMRGMYGMCQINHISCQTEGINKAWIGLISYEYTRTPWIGKQSRHITPERCWMSMSRKAYDRRWHNWVCWATRPVHQEAPRDFHGCHDMVDLSYKQ